MKTCPVCRARTFEDAEVCYGCLHRFEGGGWVAAAPEDAAWEPADVAQRAASVPPSAQTQHRLQANTQMRSQEQARARTQPHEPAGPRTQPPMPSDDASATGDPSAAGGVPSAGGGACIAGEPPAGLSPASRSNAGGAACRAGGPFTAGDVEHPEGAALHARPAIGLPATPFDHAGWIVRFELPGGVARASGATGGGARPAEAYGTLPPGGEAGTGPLSLVISICPLREGEGAAARAPVPRDAPKAGGRLPGGDVTVDDPAPAALAARRGRHAGLPVPATGEKARP